MDEKDSRAFEAISRGDLQTFKGMVSGSASMELLTASLKVALGRCDKSASEYILKSFSHKDHRGKTLKPFLFDKTHRGRNGVGWVVAGDGPWLHLFESGRNMKNPDFAACARLLIEDDTFDNSLPVSLSDDQLANGMPLSYAARKGDAQLVKELMESGVPINGYYPNSESSFLSVKPKQSPLSVALRNGHGAIALTLLAAGADPYQDNTTRCKGAAVNLISGEKDPESEEFIQARLAFRVALKLDGWKASAAVLLEASNTSNPLDHLPGLEVWMATQALKAERMALATGPKREEALNQKAPASAPETIKTPKLSFFARLMRQGEPAPEVSATPLADSPAPRSKAPPRRRKTAAEEALPPPRRRETAAEEALLGGKAHDFAKELAFLQGEEQSRLLLTAWSLAKAAFWRMPLPGGVGEQGRDPALWGCFKAAAMTMEPEALNRPLTEMGGLSLMGIASALGQSDVCSLLVERGARADPDPLLESAAPVALATRFGHSDLALNLLDAGADPLEGFKPSAFELPRRGWAVHEALEKNDERVLERMLSQEPRCAGLRNARGEDLFDAASRRLDAAGPETIESARRARSMCEAALMRSAAERPIPPRSGKAHGAF